MTAFAFSLDPAGRQPRGIAGRPAAPPALAPERARGIFAAGHDRGAGPAVAASLVLHLAVAAAILAAFGADTMGGAGGGAGDGQGSGLVVELVAWAPASTGGEAAAPEVPQEIVLPSPPTDATAFPLDLSPPEPIRPATVADRPDAAKTKEPPASATKPSARAARTPSPAAAADTASASGAQAAAGGVAGASDTGGTGGDQVAALGGAGQRVLQARFRVTPPPPPYPRRALSQRQEGIVLLRALIDAQGSAREIRLQASSGYPLLDRAALQAVEEWQFAPETVNGRAVAVWVEVPVRFRIE